MTDALAAPASRDPAQLLKHKLDTPPPGAKFDLSLLDADAYILIWSERQAELLRRRAAGELVNDADIDWPNVAEEIEDVGRSYTRSSRCSSRRCGTC